MALQLGLGAVLGGAPALDAPAAEIQSYLVDDGGNVLLAATMGTLSAFFFICCFSGPCERSYGPPRVPRGA